jgi:hypothetical protein
VALRAPPSRLLLALAAAAALALALAAGGSGTAAAQPAPDAPAPDAPASDAPAPSAPAPSMPAPSAPAPRTPSDALREANDAAAAGDWARVSALVDPLLDSRFDPRLAPSPWRGALPPADLAEAHRLSGIAAFYQQRRDAAEAHFLAYLKIDLDGRLDPALYPPEVVGFFDEVRTKHQAELRARRPKARRYWLLNLIPPGGQIQNREIGKAWVIGSLLGAFAVGNVTTYLVLRSWCTQVSGDRGSSVTCDEGTDHARAASTLRVLNIISGVGLIATYFFGAYDGAAGFRRQTPVRPYLAGGAGGSMIGIAGAF